MIRTFQTNSVRKISELSEKLWDFTPLDGTLRGTHYNACTPFKISRPAPVIPASHSRKMSSSRRIVPSSNDKAALAYSLTEP